MKLDLPAFGRPSRPTSASTRSSSARRRLSPGSPRVNWRGARLMLDLKWMLPSPPLPACTSILASSMNFMVRKQKSPIGDDRALLWRGDRLGRNHADSVVGRRAAHCILHLAGDAGVERVVPSHADVRSRMHFGAALAHEDLA